MKSNNCDGWSKTLFIVMVSILIGAILAFGSMELRLIDTYTTTADCDNNTQMAYNYGITTGMNYTLNALTQEMIQCNTLPISHAGYNYTLVAAECLQGAQNGN